MILFLRIFISVLIFLCLVWAGYRDFKDRIIPDKISLIILVFSSIYFYLTNGVDFVNYFYFILFGSGFLLFISEVVDYFLKPKKDLFFPLVLLLDILLVFVLKNYIQSFELLIICFILFYILVNIILEFIMKNKNSGENEIESSVGGGDIKLIAVLGPILCTGIIDFLFLSVLLAGLYMKIKKEDNIYLVPFMAIAFVPIVLLNFIL